MAKTNLENVNPKENEPEDVTSMLDDDTGEPGYETGLQFDNEGNLIEDGDEDDTQEPEPEEVDEFAEAVTGTKQPDKPKHKLTPAEIAIIETRKANKVLAQRLKDLESKLAEKEQAKTAESGIAKYIEQGNDEETAKRLYNDEKRSSVLEERVELLDFREENAEVFAKYPQARANAKDIMRVVKEGRGFITPEQVCAGLYGSGKPDREARAIAAARGESTREVDANGKTLSRQDRGSAATTTGELTAAQRKDKARLERIFTNGKPMTVKEYLETI